MLNAARARRLAEAIQLDLDDTKICLPCLSIVAAELEAGYEPKIRGALVSMTPTLWAEGLEAPARTSVADAARRGVRDAAAALLELNESGPRTPIARAIVRVLAAQLNVRSQASWAAKWN